MSTNDSKAPIWMVKRVQFRILSPDEIVSIIKGYKQGDGDSRIYLLFILKATYVGNRGWSTIC